MHASEACRGALDAAACGAGSHALAELAVLLALATLAAGCVARASGRSAPAARRARTLSASIAASIAVAVLAFAGLALGVARGGAFLAADRGFSDAAHAGLSAPALQAFEWITWLGNGSVLALLCAVVAIALFARGERVLATGLVVALGGNGVLDALLKRVFARVRPPPDGALQQFHGWSFPSGHAAGALVACGFLAYIALRLLPRRVHVPCVMAATGLALLVGASRVFVNAHYASDVLAGFASGTAWLLACILVVERGRLARAGSHGARPELPPALAAARAAMAGAHAPMAGAHAPGRTGRRGRRLHAGVSARRRPPARSC